jgi:hypothetical protein
MFHDRRYDLRAEGKFVRAHQSHGVLCRVNGQLSVVVDERQHGDTGQAERRAGPSVFITLLLVPRANPRCHLCLSVA